MNLFRKKSSSQFFSAEAQSEMTVAIQQAEAYTTGEIRVFIEKHCSTSTPQERVLSIFHSLQMEKTVHRNATLIYVAWKDRCIAIYGDEGLHKKMGISFWEDEIKKAVHYFAEEKYTEGIIALIKDVGISLKEHFPTSAEYCPKNELPDEIVFGA